MISLRHAEQPIREAIERLVESPRALRRFVIVENPVTERFVQFGINKEGELFLDLPAGQLDGEALSNAMDFLQEAPMPVPPGRTFQFKCETVREAAEMAMVTLRTVLRLPEQAELTIEEGATEPSN